ncbi:LysR family transcriptional regulator [Acidovorax sp. Leaf78]|uniref:LysR family transcriptional regulator n=1 Tax=unclassified Acidovorax TaxID=2684926 RepID=UPI0006F728E5|nr:LysR family transcriptional regulator [Acidovorax sp. Leaf78]KQO15484.1 LysR family transcriptional regulator [Acidovorax sp. Leaf78]
MRDLRLEDLHLFARVADLGSLSAAARERTVPVSQVSRTLARIEQASGARLVHRTTHGLTLTAEGLTFLDYCRRITGTLDELEGEFAHQSGQPSGWVRVAASSVVAEHLLIPSFESLQQAHPQLRVELVVDDRIADMAQGGIDIAIRTGAPPTDTVVARPLGTLARRLYATPGYLQLHGAPQHPEDLHQHRLITNNAVAMLNRWPFVVEGHAHVVAAEGHWRSGSTGITARLALQGLGIARLATVVAEPLVRQGQLAPVLAAWVDPQPSPIHAITLTRRHRLPKIQACIDHWAQWFTEQESAS